MSSINSIGSAPVSNTNDVSALEHTGAAQTNVTSTIGNVVSSFSEVANNIGSGIGNIFSSLGSIFGGGKTNSPNSFDLGSIIGAIFDNPIFKMFEGIFGGGKKLDAVSAPPPQGQPVAQDSEGSLYPARSGVSAEDEDSDSFDADAAVGNGLPLSAIDDIDNTSSPSSNLAQSEGEK